MILSTTLYGGWRSSCVQCSYSERYWPVLFERPVFGSQSRYLLLRQRERTVCAILLAEGLS